MACEYRNLPLTTLSDPYTCKAKSLCKGQGTEVTGVSMNHLGHKSNDHVEYFRLLESKIEYFPSNVESFFPNLQGLRIKACIKEISREDLRPFPQLKLLALDGNMIEVLERDLFDYTQNLKWIYFENNNIAHVGPNLLKSLSKLEWAYFSGNVCIDEDAAHSRDIYRFLLKISARCPPTTGMIIQIIREKYGDFDEPGMNMMYQSARID